MKKTGVPSLSFDTVEVEARINSLELFRGNHNLLEYNS